MVTGESSQNDLPKFIKSGLDEAIRILKGIDDVVFITFTESEIVRHRLVQKIMMAYESDAQTVSAVAMQGPSSHKASIPDNPLLIQDLTRQYKSWPE